MVSKVKGQTQTFRFATFTSLYLLTVYGYQVNELYNPELDGRFKGDVEAAYVESDGDCSVVCPMKELAKMLHAAGTVGAINTQ